jgi:outer membrane protein TolC
MKTTRLLIATAIILITGLADLPAQTPTTPQRLTLPECLELALKQNPAILKAQQEIQRTRGIIIEARAPAIPQVAARAQYQQIDVRAIDVFPGSASQIYNNQKQPWSAQIEVSQLVYSGGRVSAALRAARLTDQTAALGFQRTVADTILAVRKAFYGILLSQAQVEVRQQSVKLLEQQLTDTQHRFDVGAVPRFNVLRAEVELANAKPPLIRAQNDLRLAKEALVRLLGLDSSAEGQNDFTLITFDGHLAYEHRAWQLGTALTDALKLRPELQLAETQTRISQEALNVAGAGYKPEVSVFANYGWRNSMFADTLDDTRDGWTAGARLSWAPFDGLLTRGKVTQARAQLEQARIDTADIRRGIELEVRQAYSDYLQALELLEAQKKTVEQAEESLRLAEARFQAGTGVQLDVLSAQTALTEARSNEVQALYDYNVALATLERATGNTVK